jgi:hypothetical protein
MGPLPRPKKTAPALVAALALSTLAAGCGWFAPRGDVNGRLTLKGEPLAEVQVYFVPEPGQETAGPAAGATAADGTYTLADAEGRAGAAPGRYRVVLQDLQSGKRSARSLASKAGARRDAAEAAKMRVPERYTSATTTPLQFEIKTGKQTIDLNLEP